MTPTTLLRPVTILTGSLQIFTGALPNPTMMVKWDFTNVNLMKDTKVTLPDPSQGTLADVTTMLDGASDITIIWSGRQSILVNTYFLSVIIQAEIEAYLLKK